VNFHHYYPTINRVYFIFLPLTVALVRYLFEVQSNWVARKNVNFVVNKVLLWTFVFISLITLSSIFPVTDYKHGPYNHCIGRFEIYFDPKNMDPITPGNFQCILSLEFYVIKVSYMEPKNNS